MTYKSELQGLNYYPRRYSGNQAIVGIVIYIPGGTAGTRGRGAMRMCRLCVNCLRVDDCAICVFCKVSLSGYLYPDYVLLDPFSLSQEVSRVHAMNHVLKKPIKFLEIKLFKC